MLYYLTEVLVTFAMLCVFCRHLVSCSSILTNVHKCWQLQKCCKAHCNGIAVADVGAKACACWQKEKQALKQPGGGMELEDDREMSDGISDGAEEGGSGPQEESIL